MLNFFIGIAFFEAGAFFGFFVAALILYESLKICFYQLLSRQSPPHGA